MPQYDTTKIIVTGPLFKVTSGRAIRMLDAESLVVITARQGSDTFDFHVEMRRLHPNDFDLLGQRHTLRPDPY